MPLDKEPEQGYTSAGEPMDVERFPWHAAFTVVPFFISSA
jgi:hypothetical protein